MQNNKNFHDTITDLEDELESKINSVVSVNTKYRHEKKEMRHTLSLVNELLTKLGLETFTIDPKLSQRLDNVELLALVNNAIRAINSKL